MSEEKVEMKVAFREFSDGDVIALFPDEQWNDTTITSYMHIGQHGGASPELLEELNPAKKADIAELKAELETIGYIVEEIK